MSGRDRLEHGWERGFTAGAGGLLAALAVGYRGLLGAREWLYARGALATRALDCPVVSIGRVMTRYHISLQVADVAGVLATIAQCFARHDVSIQTVRQDGHGADAQLVIVTHRATDAALSATVDDLRELDAVLAVTSVMRVEGE